MNFINNLKQTISFKLLSVSGYLVFLFLLFGHFVLYPYDYQNSIDKEFGGIDAIAFIVIVICKYFILVLILLTSGFVEYVVRKKKNKFKENKTNVFSFLFILGLLFIIFLFLYILYDLFFYGYV